MIDIIKDCGISTIPGTDVTDAINTAILNISNAGGDTIIFPALSFKITSPIIQRANVILRGSGVGTQILSYGDIAFSNDGIHALNNAGIKNMKIINCSGNDNPNALGLNLNSGLFSVFEDLYFYGYWNGQIAKINPTLTNQTINPFDSINFLFNKFNQIYTDECRNGFVICGGLSSGPITNGCSLNEYRNIILRNVTGIGIQYPWWGDNDRWYNIYMMLTTDGATGIDLSSGSATDYIGVAAHHFYSPTIVRNDYITYNIGLNGILINNAPNCVFKGVASDFTWPNGNFVVNNLGVELFFEAGYAYTPNTSNKMMCITEGSNTHQSGKIIAPDGVTSINVSCLMRKPPTTVLATPYYFLGAGITYWIDESSITATGFTIRFSAPLPNAGSLRWSAQLETV